MVTKAFILIGTGADQNKEIVNELRQLKGVKSADRVTGPYDIILIVEGETLDGIGDLITDKIQPVASISRTVTCLAI